MISLEQCKKILNKTKKKYTDDEIKAIREWLYRIAEIEYQRYTQKDTKQ
jgi:hypothetical protein